MLSDSKRNRVLICSLVLALMTFLSVVYAGEKAEKVGKVEKVENKGKTVVPDFVELTWPEPPLEARIKFVDVLASELDLGRKITFKESFKSFLTGEKPEIAKMYQPRDLEVSEDTKRVYVSDFGESAIYVFNLDTNKLETFEVTAPFGIALDNEENLYVAQPDEKHIRVLNSKRETIRLINDASLVRPTDVAIDRERKLVYVADASRKASEDHSVKVFDYEGKLIRKVGNGKGDCEGCFYFPTYVSVDSKGNVYVTSTLNARVDVFDTEGKYLRSIGERGTGFGQFDKPKGIAFDTFGNTYVADSGWSNVQIFNDKGEVLLFFGGRGGYPGLMKNPTGITIDRNNKIYVADYLNYRVSVYQLVNTKPEDSHLEIPPLEGEEVKPEVQKKAADTLAAEAKSK